MPKKSTDDPARKAQKRVEVFLDCIARMLARKWLRDQRESADDTPQQADDPPSEAEP